jgi:TPR repeat protein
MNFFMVSLARWIWLFTMLLLVEGQFPGTKNIITYGNANDPSALPLDFGKSAGLTRETSMTKDQVDYILKGVESGSRDSLYFFGLMKLYGLVLSKSEPVGAQHIRRAAELEHPEATTAYGVLLMHGTGVKQDFALAQMWLRKGVHLNDGHAHWLLGQYVYMFFVGASR